MMKHNRLFGRRFNGMISLGVVAAVVSCVENQNDIGSIGSEDMLHSDANYDTSPRVDEAAYQSFLGGINGFGLELFRRKAVQGESNVVFSPVSLGVALSMAYAGAAGDTAIEMKTVLRDPFGELTYHQAMNRLVLDLRARQRAATTEENPKSIELSLVDAAYMQRGMDVRTKYLDILATQYNAGMNLADFAANTEEARVRINDYVSGATQDKITELLAPGVLQPLTRLVLINALYLKATWANPFVVSSTADGEFHRAAGDVVSVPMMHTTQSLGYAAGANYQAVSLPYVGDELSMLVILPAEGQFGTVRDGFDEIWVNGVDRALAQGTIQLTLPKFRLLWGTEEFNAELSAMGMPSAFGAAADFSGINDEPLVISKVLQKAYVGVDESGTEAAAASAVVVTRKSAIGTVTLMTVERPFLFAIRDKTGAILFVGQVMDPS